jgi:hypothetical protein
MENRSPEDFPMSVYRFLRILLFVRLLTKNKRTRRT